MECFPYISDLVQTFPHVEKNGLNLKPLTCIA